MAILSKWPTCPSSHASSRPPSMVCNAPRFCISMGWCCTTQRMEAGSCTPPPRLPQRRCATKVPPRCCDGRGLLMRQGYVCHAAPSVLPVSCHVLTHLSPVRLVIIGNLHTLYCQALINAALSVLLDVVYCRGAHAPRRRCPGVATGIATASRSGLFCLMLCFALCTDSFSLHRIQMFTPESVGGARYC